MNQLTTYNSYNKSLWIALAVFLMITCFELIAILSLNSGHLIFTLDDPYIHLALAENILNGHYGVNYNEFSAPSSSILWPFIIAPFSNFSNSPYALLAINVASAIGTIVLFWKVLLPAYSKNIDEENISKTLTVILIISIPSINLVGLIFTGMEHSFQLFFAALIIYGLTYEIEHKTIPWWFIVAIVAAPLIRYECLALSLPVIFFIYLRGYRMKSISIAGLLLFLLGAFAVFLVILDLDPFPTSVVAKSSVISSGGSVKSLLGNLKNSVSSSRGILLIISMLALLYSALNKERKMELRLLAFVVSISASLHLLVGKYGWYNRYEIYIWSSSILTLLYLNKDWIYQLPKKIGFYTMAGLMALSSALLCAPYFVTLITNPIASNNIYEQQYQMHRFATEYYNKPLAVNDLGYVSYQNNNYVLDLWGLASMEALKMNDGNAKWIANIIQKNNIKFAMIYDNWFKNRPNYWQKLGELRIGRMKVTPAEASVSFYAMDCESYTEIYPLIEAFSTTLPEGVVFEIAPNNCINTDKLKHGS